MFDCRYNGWKHVQQNIKIVGKKGSSRLSGDMFPVLEFYKRQHLKYKDCKCISVFISDMDEYRGWGLKWWQNDRVCFWLGGRVGEVESRRAFSHERVRDRPNYPVTTTTDSVESVRFHTPLLLLFFLLQQLLYRPPSSPLYLFLPSSRSLSFSKGRAFCASLFQSFCTSLGLFHSRIRFWQHVQMVSVTGGQNRWYGKCTPSSPSLHIMHPGRHADTGRCNYSHSSNRLKTVGHKILPRHLWLNASVGYTDAGHNSVLSFNECPNE